MNTRRKATGLYAQNGEIHVDDTVRFDDGWLCIVARITEQNGKIGFYLEDDLGIYYGDSEFFSITEDILFCELDGVYADFEILPEDHNTWYGIHAPLYGEAYEAACKFEKRRNNT